MGADVRMKGFQKRASVADVQALVDARIGPLGLERVPFRSALGRVLAEDVVSPRDVPPHPRSAMDGYAVRAADCPGTLDVVAEVKAAEQLPFEVQPGQAVRIMTGARVPAGADAVVMVEDTKLDGARVAIASAPKPGQHVLDTGSDLGRGQVVLAKGRRLLAHDVAMLVSVGALEVAVQRRPRVRIIPTGTELVRAGVEPTGSQVVESNSFMLEALALRDGAEVMLHPIVPDDLGMIRRALSEPGADVIVSTGGSSVGVEDFLPVVVRELGELVIHGVDVRPASPTGVGFIGATAVVLAPGFPVASYVAWDLFVRPIVQRMGGVEPVLPYRITRARLAKDVKKPASRVEIQRVVLSRAGDGGLPLASGLPGGAAILSTLTRADGFVWLPAGTAELGAGTEVDVHLYADRAV
ncbi:molybdopterin molybdotransferase MoeA [Myxococcota bacterium]|nr:molybdopterin molybdotransferase MoeA [Myxococcota bacterium]